LQVKFTLPTMAVWMCGPILGLIDTAVVGGGPVPSHCLLVVCSCIFHLFLLAPLLLIHLLSFNYRW
jgi:hypothetical protein